MKREVGLLLALFGLVGCGGSGMTYSQGQERGRCFPDGTCNPGLVCLSDTCVNPTPAGGTGGASTFDGAAGAGGGAADSPLALDAGGGRDDGAQDTSIGGTGGSMRMDAPLLVDGSQGGSGGGTGGTTGSGGTSSSGGTTGSGGISSTGGRTNSGGLDGGSAGSGGTFSSGGSGGARADGGGTGGATGGNCGLIAVTASHVPADVLLVLDRSGSMGYSIAEDCYCSSSSGSGAVCSDTTICTSRWPALVSAVDATLTSTTAINWGLKLYATPGNSICTVNAGVEVLISASSVAAIQQQIGNVSPGGNTPTAAAITAATAYLNTVADANSKAILLATDGEPNCKGGSSSTADLDGTVMAITAARAAGFLVYVIGIGPSVGNLDNFAQAGGTGQYYPATSSQDLAGALKAISTAVTTCSFTLATAAPDPNNVAVYLDKSIVPQDSINGWSFGANSQTIIFGGTFCDKIISGSAASVQVLFGCPGGSPPFPQVLP